ncbi:predicted protein [Naegleria gruberi]|uniref:Predicted protein n=1 Tax=Naegleria gruberi TaxID=5762 RepID=D2VH39_NAEGR|nr:uncharacterized protein NAEGRDRAFT_68266 [Naegleria gruberi]EFC43914.1 predicted protein [Naegleria gruberi]|eukprot:XP_002676658.1 predicted protein [Naegleria gruberi strain NEG-M]
MSSQGVTFGGNENFSLDDDFDYVDSNSNTPTPLRPKNKLLTNISSPMTPIHTRSDSLSQTFIMNISPLRDIKEDKFHEVETQLQTWIENSLGIKFAKKDSGLDVKSSPSLLPDIASKKESSRNFYYNLENGLVLCKLLQHYFPTYIAYEKVHQFDQQLFSLSSDKAFNSNYLFNAKNNMALFLAGLRKVDGFPVDLLFTFEDVFLQKNKKLILCSLTQLHEKALFNKQQMKEMEKQVQEEQKLLEQFEEDLRIIQEEATSPSGDGKLKLTPGTPEIEISPTLTTSVSTEARKPSPTTRALPSLPIRKPTTTVVSTPTESSVTDFLNQLDNTTVEDNTDSTIKTIISVFTLPLVIATVILLKLLKFFGKSKTN